MSKIPKVIHYCWFGKKPLPFYAQECINSWRIFCPDYNIIEWNESNFDVNSNKYIQEAYKEKKYAFVSDYARFLILYKYGGCYFDTDVEIIKPIDEIVERGPFFGCENWADEGKRKFDLMVAPGLGMACEAHNPFYKEMIELYDSLSFYKSDNTLHLKTIVDYTTEKLVEYGLKNEDKIQCINGIYIYPKDYFCPIEHVNELKITLNTVSIHNYAGSWLPLSIRIKKMVIRILGKNIWNIVLKFRGVR